MHRIVLWLEGRQEASLDGNSGLTIVWKQIKKNIHGVRNKHSILFSYTFGTLIWNSATNWVPHSELTTKWKRNGYFEVPEYNFRDLFSKFCSASVAIWLTFCQLNESLRGLYDLYDCPSRMKDFMGWKNRSAVDLIDFSLRVY